MEGDAELVQRRIAQLEGRVTWILVVLAAGIIASLLAGPSVRSAASQSQILRTSAVEIVDTAGRVRIALDAVNNKPGIWLYDSAGQRRIGLTVGAYGNADVLVNDATGNTRIALRVGYDRAAEVRLADSLGRQRIGATVGYDDAPGLWMFDQLTRPRIGMKVFTNGTPGFWLFENPSGKVLFSAP